LCAPSSYEAFSAAEQMFGRANRGAAPDLYQPLARSISSIYGVTRCVTTVVH